MEKEQIKKAAETYKAAFTAGAEWRINSVWQRNITTPEYYRCILIEFNWGVSTEYRLDSYNNDGNLDSGTDWDAVVRWAYIEDLLPQEGGKK